MLAEEIRLREADLERADLRAWREQQVEVLAATVVGAVVEHLFEHRDRVPRRRRAEQVEVALRELHVRRGARARTDADAPPELAGLGLGDVDREIQQVLVSRHRRELEPRPSHRELVLEETRAVEVRDRLVDLRHVDALTRHRADLAPDDVVARVRVAANKHVAQRLLRAFLDLEHESHARLLVVALLGPTHAERARHAVHARERSLRMAALAVVVLDRGLIATDPRVVVVVADLADQQRQHFRRRILGLVRGQHIVAAHVFQFDRTDHVARPFDDDEVHVGDGAVRTEPHVGHRHDGIQEAATAIEELKPVDVFLEQLTRERTTATERPLGRALHARLASQVVARAQERGVHARERAIATERDLPHGDRRTFVDAEGDDLARPLAAAFAERRLALDERDVAEREAGAAVLGEQDVAHRLRLGARDLSVRIQAEQRVDLRARELLEPLELDSLVDLDLQFDDENEIRLVASGLHERAHGDAALVPKAADVRRDVAEFERLADARTQSACDLDTDVLGRRTHGIGADLQHADRAQLLAEQRTGPFVQQDLGAVVLALRLRSAWFGLGRRRSVDLAPTRLARRRILRRGVDREVRDVLLRRGTRDEPCADHQRRTRTTGRARGVTAWVQHAG